MAYASAKRMKVVICGGGIASLCLAHALTSYSHLDVKIFEASETLRDEGAAIGLGSNAQEALRLISPQLRDALDESAGVRMDPSLRLMMAGPDSGRHIGDVSHAVAQIVVHRGSFLRALRGKIPDGVLRMGKKLSQIDLVDDQIQIEFEDKTSCMADVLVGCDGISSTVRKSVLGADHPAASPKYTGGYNHRVIVPLNQAIEAFGVEYCNLKTQHGWVGESGFLLTDFVDKGTAMQVIAGWSTEDIWSHDRPYIPWSKERLRADLARWGDIGKAMTKIFTQQPQLYAAGGRSHGETPTYCRDHMCLVGDAAQSLPPFQGAGAGQAIEDVLILETVLGLCYSKTDINTALAVYDAIRRPRRADVAASSMWAARLLTGRDPDAGLNVEKIGRTLESWGSNIYGYDLAGSQQEARERMLEKSSTPMIQSAHLPV